MAVEKAALSVEPRADSTAGMWVAQWADERVWRLDAWMARPTAAV
jgi:hypothetical protein